MVCFLSITSRMFAKHIMATHWSLKKYWNNADRFWWMQMCWFQTKKKISIHFWIKFAMVQTMALNQQRNKPLTRWHLRDWNVIVKMHFSVLFCWLASLYFLMNKLPWDLTNDKSTLVYIVAWCGQATSYYLIKSWYGSMFPNGFMH